MIKNNKESINQKLIGRLQLIYDGKPWYGKSICAVLSMSKSPINQQVLAIINHMTAWRNFTAAALEGNGYSIELNTEQDWPAVRSSQSDILSLLEKAQERLICSVKNFDGNSWHDLPKSGEYNFLQLCEGIIDHDIYHLGQIAMEIKIAVSE